MQLTDSHTHITRLTGHLCIRQGWHNHTSVLYSRLETYKVSQALYVVNAISLLALGGLSNSSILTKLYNITDQSYPARIWISEKAVTVEIATWATEVQRGLSSLG